MTYLTRERRPVIASLTSADAEFNHWVAQNNYHHLSDRAGTIWELRLHLDQIPHPKNVISPLYRLHIGLEASFGSEELVTTGVLDPVADARLLSLCGDTKLNVPLQIKLLEANSLEDLRSDLATYIYKLRNELKKRDLHGLKRRMITRWIDQKSLFGYALSSQMSDKIELEV